MANEVEVRELKDGMVVVRAPLRVPFAGGLTDLEEYAARFGGATVSSTIAHSVWVTMLLSPDGVYEVHAFSEVERARTLDEVGGDLVRESLRAAGSELPPVRVGLFSDVGPGSGVGSSGAAAVALVHAGRALTSRAVTAAELGRDAAHVEVVTLRGASGYHDANISARGGLLRLDYDGPLVSARPLTAPPGFRREFEESLLFFATGWRASTQASLSKLSDNLEGALPILHDMKALATELEGAFAAGDLRRVAWVVSEQQRLKQLLPGNFVDERVHALMARLKGLDVGVQLPGGKISGYVLVSCPAGQHGAVRKALEGFAEVPLRLTEEGSSARAFSRLPQAS